MLQGQGLGDCTPSLILSSPGSHSGHLGVSLQGTSESFATQTTLSFQTPAFWLHDPLLPLMAPTGQSADLGSHHLPGRLCSHPTAPLTSFPPSPSTSAAAHTQDHPRDLIYLTFPFQALKSHSMRTRNACPVLSALPSLPTITPCFLISSAPQLFEMVPQQTCLFIHSFILLFNIHISMVFDFCEPGTIRQSPVRHDPHPQGAYSLANETEV